MPEAQTRLAQKNLLNQQRFIDDIRKAAVVTGTDWSKIASYIGTTREAVSAILDNSVSGGNGTDLTMTEIRHLALAIGVEIEYKVKIV